MDLRETIPMISGEFVRSASSCTPARFIPPSLEKPEAGRPHHSAIARAKREDGMETTYALEISVEKAEKLLKA